jgi:hypothetical protein
MSIKLPEHAHLRHQRIRQMVHDTLMEHTPADATPYNTWPNIPVKGGLARTRRELFWLGQQAATVGVNRAVLRVDFPIAVRNMLSGPTVHQSISCTFIPAQHGVGQLEHFGHDLIAIIDTGFEIEVFSLGCCEHIIEVHTITPTLRQYRCRNCPLRYERDTSD